MKRSCENPVLDQRSVPYHNGLVFNAGITKYQGKYVMAFRNDYGDWNEQTLHGTSNIGLAYSDDGIHWKAMPEPCFSMKDDEFKRAYDPRLTVIDGRMFMCFAIDTNHGLRGGIAETEDFQSWNIHSMSLPDNRNMVLFPEKINGNYVRLERPFPIYSRPGPDRFDCWTGHSPDLRYWGDHALLLGVEDVEFANDKVGPGAPPVKTEKGWLTTFHAVWRDNEINLGCWGKGSWNKEYYTGLMLFDLENPGKIIGKCPVPLLSSTAEYECKGFRNNVIFPGGMILEDSGEVKIYYGAADAVECLATADVNDLLTLCLK